jgi:YD repeat-containing protein
MIRTIPLKAHVTLLLLAVLLNTYAGTETLSFGYDPASRLTTYSVANGPSLAYSYDASGNLIQSASPSGSDSDLDGMDDSWEMTYFRSRSRDGEGDFDSDGLNDRSEFLAGTNPLESSSNLRISLAQSAPNIVTLSWMANSGKNYRLQFKDSLSAATWTELSSLIPSTSGLVQTNDAVPRPPARFYRLELSP